MTAPHQSGPARHGADPDTDDHDLLAALLDGMDAALCAFDADGTVTHWNREAERILGWSAEEAVGRRGLAGWALRKADAEEATERLLGVMKAPGRRQVDEFALLTKDGGRILVRMQSSAVPGADGGPSGVYCAFSEVHT
ncbi:diguanylate cyclase, partial [Streptomyces sp. NRRL B-1568]